ncbi:hypothetical protein KI387_043708 [Taxus chinensis]|uniref:Uncharacterized protein n=1 Tax=Taxus chinensis TaxID=29808 RepID=A0AA38H0W6_TAXCH|nr:hypothetical protein KI387_043708 [Taxus chinensis]
MNGRTGRNQQRIPKKAHWDIADKWTPNRPNRPKGVQVSPKKVEQAGRNTRKPEDPAESAEIVPKMKPKSKGKF